MKKILNFVSALALMTATSTAAMAQDIPLNIFVTGSTGGESTQSQGSGSLAVTTTSTTTVSTLTSMLAVSTGATVSTN